jgi:hypothetical protein
MAEAAGIALGGIVHHLLRPGNAVEEVTMVLFDQRAFEIHREAAGHIRELVPA